jgi:hypothetical protein
MFDRKMFLTHLGSINGKADGNRINLSEDDKGLYAPEAIRASNKTGKTMVLGKDGKLYPQGADPTRAQPGSATSSGTASTTSRTQRGFSPLPSAPPIVYPDELYQEPTPNKVDKYVKIGDGPMAYWKRRVDVHPQGDNYGYSEYKGPRRPIGGHDYWTVPDDIIPDRSFKTHGEAMKAYRDASKVWGADMSRRTLDAARQQDIDVNRDIEREMRDADEPTIRVRPVMTDIWIQPEEGLGGPIRVQKPKMTMGTFKTSPEPRSTYAPEMIDDEGRPVSSIPKPTGKIGIPHDPRYVDPRELFPDEFTGPFVRPHPQQIKPSDMRSNDMPYLDRMSSSAGRKNSEFWA